MVQAKNRAIVFFDGDCSLCHTSVRFLVRLDRQQRLYFAPLQGVAAQALLPQADRESLNTVVYHRVASNGSITRHTRSDAVLFAVIDTRSLLRFAAQIARLLPCSFRDWLYNCVANNRSKWFHTNSCRLPSRAEHDRILP